ncbi:MAG: hypothetical protein ABI837_05850, partial [Acidobacteriota bacterium]
NTATIASTTPDPNPGAESATASSTVANADLSVTKVDTPDPVIAGTNLSYDITIDNAGPADSIGATLTDTLPPGTTFVSLTAPARGWSCTTPAVGAPGTISCSIPTFATPGTDVFTLVVAVAPSVTQGSTLTNTATASATTPDLNPANDSGSAVTTIAGSADLSVTKVDNPDPVTPGANLAYAITVNNAGPSNGQTVTLSDTLPANTTFVSLTAPAGWSCTPLAVGATGTVSCTNASLAIGNSAPITLTVATNPALTAGTTITNTATVSASTPDPNMGNQSGSATTTVGAPSADLSVTKVATPDPVVAGTNLTYTITATNAGPSNAAGATLTDGLPAGTTFVSLASPGGWSCTTPAVGAGGVVSCSIASVGAGNAVFTLVVKVAAATAGGTVITNTATIAATTLDPNPANQSGSAATTVAGLARLSATKSAAGFFASGTQVTYTIVITNNGSGPHTDNPGHELTDILPVQLQLVSASATSGTALATIATNTVTWDGALAAGASVTITVKAIIGSTIPNGTTVSNQASIAFDGDGNGTNEASAVSDDPSQPGAADPTTFTVIPPPASIPALDGRGLMLMAALLAAIGWWAGRRA